MNYTDRFDGKGEIYAKARPKYAAGLFDYLKNTLGIPAGSVFADIGSGTGIFTGQLLNCGYKVYAVEPNDDMRKKAEEKLSDNKSFISVNGSSSDTTLPDGSVDNITVAQAFHSTGLIRYRLRRNANAFSNPEEESLSSTIPETKKPPAPWHLPRCGANTPPNFTVFQTA